ncbi:hypothetical protein G6F19_005252 [Rhizopus arrhizus]|nr:hypothetical protein G6F20_005026 [Rhizopus arrhizus]KAG0834327.1 hypothetical protein G6F19_005252 [Rhizopus arrhizus]KAG0885657.1 hypothetical protein G6F15_004013 [Rhizopus arrhizus]KAG0965364.1 hypothetical protein G6F31_005800 [Rhizopus arrhizus]KAG1010348.1 hypothetical protein G6F27_004737 [Rhizopus arrhizus]
MRCIYTISAAIAFFAASVFANSNADFNPVNFVAEEVPSSLTDSFVNFRWNGESAVAQQTFNLIVEDTARIQVTDFKNRGDRFEVFDNGKSLGTTSEVSAEADQEAFAATPEEALEDERFSKGVFTLEKGEHKITIKATGPYEAGTAAIRILDHANVAFHKKDDDDDDDDDDKDWHHDDDDDDDDDDKDWHHDGGRHHDDDDDKDWHHDGGRHHDDDDDHWHRDNDHGDWDNHDGHRGRGRYGDHNDWDNHDGHKDWDNHDGYKGGDNHDGHRDWDNHDGHNGWDNHDGHKGWDNHDGYKGGDNHDGHKDSNNHDDHKDSNNHGDHKDPNKHDDYKVYEHHEEVYPPYYDLDLSHTITVTKTVWVEAAIPTMNDPQNGDDSAYSPHYEDDHEHGKVRDHDRNHDKGHFH